ncbi:hypothetical protein tloyanaT_06800 [Thalassotalea loyana]|uniref:DUF4178 domain-containing protein n=1 Tax=Thalassotalea loyana TaxID=280483 RepID=A0ABQ6H8H3_9GAMM|nr:hypothetical protein [Thalassotalea loyana]GLX84428.1 hypothetical protein tloyanaT_06800 [Thalassotalea loyana]
MSFLKKLFSNEKPARQLTQANQLKIKDIIVLSDSFALPEQLRKQQLEVVEINSYEFEHRTDTEWVLMGTSGEKIYMTLDADDKSCLKFSYEIERDDVEAIFDLDQFALIFDEDPCELNTMNKDPELGQWLDDHYHRQAYAQVGYFHRKDHRSQAISSYQGKDSGEQFEQYSLYNDDESKGIDIEVWQDGDTDVFLTLFRPASDIKDMFPGS